MGKQDNKLIPVLKQAATTLSRSQVIEQALEAMLEPEDDEEEN